MATSSIFHHVVLDTQEKLDAFLNAIEESIADPYIRPEGPVYKVATPEEVDDIFTKFEAHKRAQEALK